MISYHVLLFIVILQNTGDYTIKNIFRGFNGYIAILVCIPPALSGLVLYFLWPLLKLDVIVFADKLAEFGIHGQLWTVFIPYYILFTPWLEEYYWRGILGSGKKFPDMSDLLFAGYHILVLFLFIKPVWVMLIFIILVFSAWIWRLIKIKFNGLLIPFISHLLADMSIIFAIYKLTF